MSGFLIWVLFAMVAELELLGIAGALLIAIAWVTDAFRVLRTRRSQLDLKFGFVYFLGSLLLTLYAFSIGSAVFSFLNLLATLSALFSLYYAFNGRVDAAGSAQPVLAVKGVRRASASGRKQRGMIK